jgi:hypothetical protein
MRLKHYFPISVGFFALVVIAAHYSPAPVLPLAVILLVGETLLGVQLEHHKVPRFLASIFKPAKLRH